MHLLLFIINFGTLLRLHILLITLKYTIKLDSSLRVGPAVTYYFIFISFICSKTRQYVITNIRRLQTFF